MKKIILASLLALSLVVNQSFAHPRLLHLAAASMLLLESSCLFDLTSDSTLVEVTTPKLALWNEVVAERLNKYLVRRP